MKLARLRRGVWNGHLNGRFGYDFAPAFRLAGSLLWLFPKRRWGAEMTVRHLPRKRKGLAPRLLDVGFGRGEFLRSMREHGWQVKGLEPDHGAVEAARAEGLDVEQGLIDDAPYPSESFDAITLSHVIEHLHDPVASLTACNRLLKAGGVLWIATPNIASRAQRRFGRDWFGLDPPRHLVIFTRKSLERALRRTGFEEVSFRRTYRGQMMVAASEAIAGEGDALSALRPVSRSSRLFGRALDFGAALRPEWGEELIAVARKPPVGLGDGRLA
jgi:SAM-dependent methyltransferase